MAEQHEKALVPQIRFTGFTDPWEQCKFSELVDRVTVASNDPLLPQVEYEDINSGEGTLNKDLGKKDGGKTGILFEPGDILYGKLRPYLMNWLHPQFRGIAIGDFWVLRPSGAEGTCLYRLIQSDSFQRLADISSGSKMPRADWSLISSGEFLIPSDDAEQRRIGAFFDRLDSLITLHQRKYDKLCVLKKSMLDKMFPKGGSLYPEIRFAGFTDPWEQRKLGELTESYSGGTPAAGESEFYGGSIPFIRSAEIAAESTELFLTEKGYESSSARMVKPGDVLYALYGATSGEVAVSRQKGAINQAILAILPRDDCDARYITAWLRKQKGYIVTTYLQGGQGNLSGVIVKNLEVFIPSLPEQQKIGFMLSHLDSLITLHQRKLELLRNIKKSMLDKMFV